MDTSVLVRCVQAATLAPSLHNSQPWRFRIEGGAVEVYGAKLTIAGMASRTVIAGLGRTAAARLRRRGGYFAELDRWTRPVAGRRDGIPAAAIGPWDALERVPMRDFGLTHPQPSRRGNASRRIRAAWLRAGQAMQRVLLAATTMRLATTPVSQPVEIASIREVLSDPETGRWAQMLIRLGYGPPAAATPRRPLSDVLAGGR
ncbi:nitroreductase family protein [Actinoplanes sp. CA-054009]